MLATGTNAIVIDVPTGTHVALSGFALDGLGNSGTPGLNGVIIPSGGNISLCNMTISGFRGQYGVSFQPTATAQLIMSNVTLTENGKSGLATSGGVLVKPGAGVTATVTIDNSRIQNNENIGVRFDTVHVVGSVINATINNSIVSSNANGVLTKTPASTGTIKLLVNRSLLEENAGVGLIVNGADSSVRVVNSVISDNGTGLLTLSNGTLFSYGNNVFDGNVIDGGFTTVLLPTQ